MDFVSLLSISISFFMASRKSRGQGATWRTSEYRMLLIGLPFLQTCKPLQQLHEHSKCFLSDDRLFTFKRLSGLNSCAKPNLFNVRGHRSILSSLIYNAPCSLYPMICTDSILFPTLLKDIIKPPISFISSECFFCLLNLGGHQWHCHLNMPFR